MTIAALIGGIAIVGWSTLASRGTENPQEREAMASTPVATVVARGRFEPVGGLIRVATEVVGTSIPYVSRLLIKTGDLVQRGQITAELSTFRVNVAGKLIAEHELARAQQRLAQLKAGPKPSEIRAQEAIIERDEAELQYALSDERRATELMSGGNISHSAMETRALAALRARATAAHSRETRDAMLDIRASDVQLAETEVAIALARLEKAEADVSSALVPAPCDGRVLEILARTGERPERELYVIADTSRMQAIAEIDEAQIDLIRAGQRAIVTPRGGRPLTGEVGRVGHLVKNEQRRTTDDGTGRDSRVVEVTIVFDSEQDVPEDVYREAVVAISIAAGA